MRTLFLPVVLESDRPKAPHAHTLGYFHGYSVLFLAAGIIAPPSSWLSNRCFQISTGFRFNLVLRMSVPRYSFFLYPPPGVGGGRKGGFSTPYRSVINRAGAAHTHTHTHTLG